MNAREQNRLARTMWTKANELLDDTDYSDAQLAQMTKPERERVYRAQQAAIRYMKAGCELHD